ncbi:MAG: nickel-dependent lactate racemase [Candidatus Latescibacterota bacterium]|nr:MAG: nickel-dependent lactate racemase [Candidatus Latescibacterota bacterium]
MSSCSRSSTGARRVVLEVPYGRGSVQLPLRDEPDVLLPGDGPKVDPEKALMEAVEHPLDTPPLREVVGGREEVAIVVDDDTRPPYARALLPPLLAFLRENGVRRAKVIVALGLHRPLDEGRKRAVFGDLPSWVEIYNHDPYRDLSPVGDVGGRRLFINRHFLSAPLKIVIGDVELHQIFGYGGGAKSLAPGISDAETITWLHSLLTHPMARPGVLEGNPVQEFLEEVYAKVRVDFSVQVVLNMRGEVLCVNAGSLRRAFLEGVEVVDRLYKVKVKEPFDVLIASAGGHPRDVDLYQTQKVINMVRAGLKEGGKLILFSRCGDGVGPEGFARWLKEGLGKEEVKRMVEERFEMGLHKLYLFAKGTKEVDVYLYSSIHPDLVRRAFLKPLEDPREVAELVGDGRIGFVPFGTVTLLCK